MTQIKISRPRVSEALEIWGTITFCHLFLADQHQNFSHTCCGIKLPGFYQKNLHVENSTGVHDIY